MITQNKKYLIPFFVSGYPNIKDCESLISDIVMAGAEIIELGVPASDPLADGPQIQLAHKTALQQEVNLNQTLKLCRRLKAKFPRLSIVLFTYFNPLHKMGLDKYASLAKEMGVSATLTVDLPFEEAQAGYLQAHQKYDLKTVFLVAPTTSLERFQNIQKVTTGFIYFVARTGVTGVETPLSQEFFQNLKTFQKTTSLPVAVGFGIKSLEQIKKLAPVTDSLVIGSYFISLIEQSSSLCEASTAMTKFYRQAVQILHQGRLS